MGNTALYVSTTPIASAVNWLVALTTGKLAITLCVLAVALVGLAMLGGRLRITRGFSVILGCFVLLGASTIAAALREVWGEAGGKEEALPMVIYAEPRAKAPPALYDPYAGASMRRN